MSDLKNNLLALVPEVMELLPNQNAKGSQTVIAISVEQQSVVSMRRDSFPNGWTPIYFGGCSKESTVISRILNYFVE